MNRYGIIFKVNTEALKSLSEGARKLERVSNAIKGLDGALNNTLSNFAGMTKLQIEAIQKGIENLARGTRRTAGGGGGGGGGGGRHIVRGNRAEWMQRELGITPEVWNKYDPSRRGKIDPETKKLYTAGPGGFFPEPAGRTKMGRPVYSNNQMTAMLLKANVTQPIVEAIAAYHFALAKKTGEATGGNEKERWEDFKQRQAALGVSVPARKPSRVQTKDDLLNVLTHQAEQDVRKMRRDSTQKALKSNVQIAFPKVDDLDRKIQMGMQKVATTLAGSTEEFATFLNDQVRYVEATLRNFRTPLNDQMRQGITSTLLSKRNKPEFGAENFLALKAMTELDNSGNMEAYVKWAQSMREKNKKGQRTKTRMHTDFDIGQFIAGMTGTYENNSLSGTVAPNRPGRQTTSNSPVGTGIGSFVKRLIADAVGGGLDPVAVFPQISKLFSEKISTANLKAGNAFHPARAYPNFAYEMGNKTPTFGEKQYNEPPQKQNVATLENLLANTGKMQISKVAKLTSEEKEVIDDLETIKNQLTKAQKKGRIGDDLKNEFGTTLKRFSDVVGTSITDLSRSLPKELQLNPLSLVQKALDSMQGRQQQAQSADKGQDPVFERERVTRAFEVAKRVQYPDRMQFNQTVFRHVAMDFLRQGINSGVVGFDATTKKPDQVTATQYLTQGPIFDSLKRHFEQIFSEPADPEKLKKSISRAANETAQTMVREADREIIAELEELNRTMKSAFGMSGSRRRGGKMGSFSDGQIGGQSLDFWLDRNFGSGSFGNRDTFADRERNVAGKVAMYGGTSMAMFGAYRGAQQGITGMADYETSIYNIKKVLNPLGADIARVSAESKAMAKEFGLGIKEVADGMAIFAQQGMGVNEILGQTRVAVLGTNVTELSLVETTEALTAAQRQFMMSTGQSLDILDAWNEVENTTAVSTRVLTESLKRAGTSSRVAGVDFHTFNGVVAAMGEATRKSGNEIGTSLKFIFQHARDAKAVEALQGVGIYSEDAAGNMKSARNVMGELANRWDTLTDAQRANVAVSIAGTRHVNDFFIMMQTWDRAIEISIDSLMSQGSAMRENDIVMESLNKKVGQLKASYQSMWASLGESGALDFLKQMADMGKGVLDILGQINNMFGGMTGSISGALAFTGLAVGGAGMLAGGLVPDMLGGFFDRGTQGESRAQRARRLIDHRSAGSMMSSAGDESMFTQTPYWTGGRVKSLGLIMAGQVGKSAYDTHFRNKTPGVPPTLMDTAVDTGSTAATTVGIMGMLKGSGKMGMGRKSILGLIAAAGASQVYSSGQKYFAGANPSGVKGTQDQLTRLRALEEKYSATQASLSAFSKSQQGEFTSDMDVSKLQELGNTIAALVPGIVKFDASGNVVLEDVKKWSKGLEGAQQTLRGHRTEIIKSSLAATLASDEFKKMQKDRDAALGERQNLIKSNAPIEQMILNQAKISDLTTKINSQGLGKVRATALSAGNAGVGIMPYRGDQLGKLSKDLGIDRQTLAFEQLRMGVQGATGMQVDVRRLLAGRNPEDVGYFQNAPDGPVFDAASGKIAATTKESAAALEKSGKVILRTFDEKFREGIVIGQDVNLTKLIAQLDGSIERLIAKNDQLVKSTEFVANTRERGAMAFGNEFAGSNVSLRSLAEMGQTLNTINQKGLQQFGQIPAGAGLSPTAQIRQLMGVIESAGDSNIGIGNRGLISAQREIVSQTNTFRARSDTFLKKLIEVEGRVERINTDPDEDFEGATTVEFFRDLVSNASEKVATDLQKMATDLANLQRQGGSDRQQTALKGLMKNLLDSAMNVQSSRSLTNTGGQMGQQWNNMSQFAVNAVSRLGIRYSMERNAGTVQGTGDFQRLPEVAEIANQLRQMTQTAQAETADLRRTIAELEAQNPNDPSIQIFRDELRQANATLELLRDKSGNLAEQFERVEFSLQEMNRRVERTVNQSSLGGAFGNTGLNDLQYGIDFLSQEIQKLNASIASETNEQRKMDMMRERDAYAQQRLSRQSDVVKEVDRRTATDDGLFQTVLGRRLSAGFGFDGESGARDYAKVLEANSREFMQRIAGQLAPNLKGRSPEEVSQVIRQIQDTMKPVTGQIRDLMLRTDTGYQKNYLLASTSERAMADSIRKQIEGGASAQEIFADPMMRMAAKDNPLLQDLMEMALESDIDKEALKAQQNIEIHTGTTSKVLAEILKILQGQGASGAGIGSPFKPKMKKGSMALAGTAAVDAEGRIRADETPAVLHKGEIVLNKNQSDAFMENHFAKGTIPDDLWNRIVNKGHEFEQSFPDGEATKFYPTQRMNQEKWDKVGNNAWGDLRHSARVMGLSPDHVSELQKRLGFARSFNGVAPDASFIPSNVLAWYAPTKMKPMTPSAYSLTQPHVGIQYFPTDTARGRLTEAAGYRRVAGMLAHESSHGLYEQLLGGRGVLPRISDSMGSALFERLIQEDPENFKVAVARVVSNYNHVKTPVIPAKFRRSPHMGNFMDEVIAGYNERAVIRQKDVPHFMKKLNATAANSRQAMAAEIDRLNKRGINDNDLMKAMRPWQNQLANDGWFNDNADHLKKDIDLDKIMGSYVDAYHGTSTPQQFSSLRPLSHLGTREAALHAATADKTGFSRLLKGKLELGNVADFTDTGVHHTPVRLARALENAGILPKHATGAVDGLGDSEKQTQAILTMLRRKGVDTLRYVNANEGKGSTSYVLTRPDQFQIEDIERLASANGGKMSKSVDDFIAHIAGPGAQYRQLRGKSKFSMGLHQKSHKMLKAEGGLGLSGKQMSELLGMVSFGPGSGKGRTAQSRTRGVIHLPTLQPGSGVGNLALGQSPKVKISGLMSAKTGNMAMELKNLKLHEMSHLLHSTFLNSFGGGLKAPGGDDMVKQLWQAVLADKSKTNILARRNVVGQSAYGHLFEGMGDSKWMTSPKGRMALSEVIAHQMEAIGASKKGFDNTSLMSKVHQEMFGGMKDVMKTLKGGKSVNETALQFLFGRTYGGVSKLLSDAGFAGDIGGVSLDDIAGIGKKAPAAAGAKDLFPNFRRYGSNAMAMMKSIRGAGAATGRGFSAAGRGIAGGYNAARGFAVRVGSKGKSILGGIAGVPGRLGAWAKGIDWASFVGDKLIGTGFGTMPLFQKYGELVDWGVPAAGRKLRGIGSAIGSVPGRLAGIPGSIADYAGAVQRDFAYRGKFGQMGPNLSDTLPGRLVRSIGEGGKAGIMGMLGAPGRMARGLGRGMDGLSGLLQGGAARYASFVENAYDTVTSGDAWKRGLGGVMGAGRKIGAGASWLNGKIPAGVKKWGFRGFGAASLIDMFDDVSGLFRGGKGYVQDFADRKGFGSLYKEVGKPIFGLGGVGFMKGMAGINAASWGSNVAGWAGASRLGRIPGLARGLGMGSRGLGLLAKGAGKIALPFAVADSSLDLAGALNWTYNKVGLRSDDTYAKGKKTLGSMKGSMMLPIEGAAGHMTAAYNWAFGSGKYESDALRSWEAFREGQQMLAEEMYKNGHGTPMVMLNQWLTANDVARQLAVDEQMMKGRDQKHLREQALNTPLMLWSGNLTSKLGAAGGAATGMTVNSKDWIDRQIALTTKTHGELGGILTKYSELVGNGSSADQKATIEQMSQRIQALAERGRMFEELKKKANGYSDVASVWQTASMIDRSEKIRRGLSTGGATPSGATGLNWGDFAMIANSLPADIYQPLLAEGGRKAYGFFNSNPDSATADAWAKAAALMPPAATLRELMAVVGASEPGNKDLAAQAAGILEEQAKRRGMLSDLGTPFNKASQSLGAYASFKEALTVLQKGSVAAEYETIRSSLDAELNRLLSQELAYKYTAGANPSMLGDKKKIWEAAMPQLESGFKNASDRYGYLQQAVMSGREMWDKLDKNVQEQFYSGTPLNSGDPFDMWKMAGQNPPTALSTIEQKMNALRGWGTQASTDMLAWDAAGKARTDAEALKAALDKTKKAPAMEYALAKDGDGNWITVGRMRGQNAYQHSTLGDTEKVVRDQKATWNAKQRAGEDALVALRSGVFGGDFKNAGEFWSKLSEVNPTLASQMSAYNQLQSQISGQQKLAGSSASADQQLAAMEGQRSQMLIDSKFTQSTLDSVNRLATGFDRQLAEESRRKKFKDSLNKPVNMEDWNARRGIQISEHVPVRDAGGPTSKHTTITEGEWVFNRGIVQDFISGVTELKNFNDSARFRYDGMAVDAGQFRSDGGTSGTITHQGEVLLRADTDFVGLLQEVLSQLQQRQPNGSGQVLRVGDPIQPNIVR